MANMAIFIPVENTALVELVYSLPQGQIGENTFHVQNTEAFTANSLGVLAAAFASWYTGHWNARVSGTTSLTKVRCTDLTSQYAPGVEYTTGLPVNGNLTGNGLPNNVSVSIKFNTGLRGRSYRGRIYALGLTDNAVNGNTVQSAWASGAITALETLVSEHIPVGMNLVVVSKYHNKTPRSAGVTTIVTSFSIDMTPDSQRRRLPGRGR